MKPRIGDARALFDALRRSSIARSDCRVRCYAAASRLVEIGKLQNCTIENYEPGQVFLHKIFGYRGVILYPWSAKLYDYDLYYKTDPLVNSKSAGNYFYPPSGGFMPPKPGSPIGFEPNVMQSNYQVLVDERDWPYMRVHKDDVCLLQKTTITRMHLLPLAGFTNVSHDDILPYAPSGEEPFKHGYLEQFFDTKSDGTSVPMKQNAALLGWRNRCLRYLKCSSVYRRTTNNIRVTVIPYYLGYGPDSLDSVAATDAADRNNRYAWRYSIRLENFGEERVVLREREWEIVDVYGRKELHNGRGVIGVEPNLSRSEPAFQYSSFMYLEAPRGHMSGAYVMQREDGTLFRCTIPLFELDSLPKSEDDSG